jgi:HTH-like domain/Integrase core domain
VSGEHEPIAEAQDARSAPEHGQPGPLGLLALSGAGRTTLPAAVLALQRQAGNRGVNRLVRQRALRRAPRPPAARAPSRTLQRRRLPQPTALVDILSDVGPAGRVAAPDSSAHMVGLNWLWATISSDLTVAERSDLMAQGMTGMTVAQLTALPLADQTAKLAPGTAALQALKPWELQERWAQALSTVKPARMLGDPLLIDVGPRPGTSDAANIQTVVDNTNKVFDEIAAEARDQDIKDVFGAANLATAKTKYKNARKRVRCFREGARRRPSEVSAFVDEHRGRFGVEPICRVLDVSASAYYQRATGQRSQRVIGDERLLERIRELHAANSYACGYRRMWKALHRAGETVGRDQVKRLMRTNGIQGAKRRCGCAWRSPAAAPAPTSSSSITQTRLAIHELRVHSGPRRISSIGDAYDNALAESFVDSFKTELIRDRVWRTRSQLELAIVEWVAWFNTTRLHEALHDRPPAEVEALYARRYVPTPSLNQ